MTPIEPVKFFSDFIFQFLFESDVTILVIPFFVDESYLQNGDGASQISATINAPENEYARYAAHASVNGELHIFGGGTDGYKGQFCKIIN